ncbi:pathogenesis-related family 1 protein [Spirulina sp. CS-785/01]|uniref:pathogenesis-related family 1 protein n=1 Tax=Spirulina sp. CS-785/01 TaxID=3021716 RepID=UPI00232E6ED6|nr:pathogenesis-related family 1 protein [Spirulina sp. CS-785/01]MDB9314262.1 pathogenesis-related family 1 protein [Spirulina sp. CS-785/01]
MDSIPKLSLLITTALFGITLTTIQQNSHPAQNTDPQKAFLSFSPSALAEKLPWPSPQMVAQNPTFPLDGQPVYVLRNNQWLEARLMGWQWNSQEGEKYTVLYVEDNTTEEGVSVDRIRSLEDAQNAGIETNVYDLSSQAGIEQMLAAHNKWRAKVGVPPVQWSPTLANYAQEWAETLIRENSFEHRQNSNYGENLATASGQQLSPERVVDMWGNEVEYYDYATNSCTPGEMCGHYTQVVWEDTKEVGCGMARNENREVWVCNYNPPGNYVGQRPY